MRVQERIRQGYRRPADEQTIAFARGIETYPMTSLPKDTTDFQFARPQDVCFSGGYVPVTELASI